MKVFALLFLFGLVAARPGHSGNSDEDSHEHDDDMDWIVDSCLVENWEDGQTDEENMKSVGACLQCFNQVGDPMTEEGLPKGKACVEQFLPWENEACAAEIAEISVEDVDSADPALECFEGFVLGALSERCLNLSTSDNSVDILTDGSMCMLETHKNMTMFHMFIKHQGQRTPKNIKNIGQDGRKGAMKEYVMSQLLPNAYCDAANGEDQTRSTSCQQCFDTIVDPKGQFGEIVKCSQEYLNPYYQECHDRMVSIDEAGGQEEWKDVFKCYMRGIIRYVVTECYTEDAEVEVDAESLMNTMECGRHYAINWVTDNAKPEFAGRIVHMFLEDDEHHHHHVVGGDSSEELE